MDATSGWLNRLEQTLPNTIAKHDGFGAHPCCAVTLPSLFATSGVTLIRCDQPRFDRAALSIAMNAQNKKLLRTIIKQVHPDVMTNYPLEQLKNSESLKASVRLPGRYVARCFDA